MFNRQKTSFGGKTQRTRPKEAQVEGLYRKLSKGIGQIPEVFHFDDFEFRDRGLYYKGKSMSLTIRGQMLRSVHVIGKILGKEGLHELGFIIPRVN